MCVCVRARMCVCVCVTELQHISQAGVNVDMKAKLPVQTFLNKVATAQLIWI